MTASLFAEASGTTLFLATNRMNCAEESGAACASSGSKLCLSAIALVWCGVILIRVLIGYQPHSGQDNYHGSRGAYGGDFEAQRHWMELTWNLPIGEWYHHDSEYWGLDYPPLSAYQSWLCAAVSHYLVGPFSVALYSSRGLEDSTHKAFMRATVLVLDLLFFGSASYVLSKPQQRVGAAPHSLRSLLGSFVTAMIQPAILLMDHGHFQYNTVALGLSLWSFYCVTKPGFEAVACILFTCALLFKQMTLYYAPAIFAYLLGNCCRPDPTKNNGGTYFVKRFVTYGMAVVVTILALGWPFVWCERASPSSSSLYAEEEQGGTEINTATTTMARLLQVLHRIFPVHRGLFEDKVANLWCALSVKPLRLTQRIPKSIQPWAALSVTMALSMPALIKLFRLGKQQQSTADKNSDKHQQQTFMLGVTSTALSFFLASFHVHEKSILLALAPACFAGLEPIVLDWLAIVATWTLYPLLVLDRLQVAYVCTLVVYACARRMCSLATAAADDDDDDRISSSPSPGQSHNDTNETSCARTATPAIIVIIQRVVWIGSVTVMVGLHFFQCTHTPPSHLPDLFPVLWSIAGCGFYLVAWVILVRQLYGPTTTTTTTTSDDHGHDETTTITTRAAKKVD